MRRLEGTYTMLLLFDLREPRKERQQKGADIAAFITACMHVYVFQGKIDRIYERGKAR